MSSFGYVAPPVFVPSLPTPLPVRASVVAPPPPSRRRGNAPSAAAVPPPVHSSEALQERVGPDNILDTTTEYTTDYIVYEQVKVGEAVQWYTPTREQITERKPAPPLPPRPHAALPTLSKSSVTLPPPRRVSVATTITEESLVHSMKQLFDKTYKLSPQELQSHYQQEIDGGSDFQQLLLNVIAKYTSIVHGFSGKDGRGPNAVYLMWNAALQITSDTSD